MQHAQKEQIGFVCVCALVCLLVLRSFWEVNHVPGFIIRYRYVTKGGAVASWLAPSTLD